MLTLALLAAASLAQEPGDFPEMNANLYRVPIETDDAGRAPNRYLTGRIAANYLNGPISVVDFYDETHRVVVDAFSLDLLGGVTFGPMRFGVDLPVYLASTSDYEQMGGAGLGDLAIDVKGTVLDPREYALGLAVGGRVQLPTSTLDLPLGDPAVRWDLRLIADKRFGDLLIAANLGTQGGPPVETQNLELNDAFLYRVGAGYALSERAGVSVDVGGQVSYSTPLSDAAGSPVEAMLGGWGRVAESVVIRGGVGTGLNRGIGAPAFHAVFLLSWEPPFARDGDGDGIADKLDGCPAEAEDTDGFEDHDGCPELDNDGDGLADAVDGCPLEAEDGDGFEDDDGCPDPTTRVHVRITDPEGRTIQGVQATFAPTESLAPGNADFSVDLEPGAHSLQAEAEGFEPISATIDIVDGVPIEVVQVMTPVAPTGIVIVDLLDVEGNSIAGLLNIAGDEIPVDGSTEFVMLAGDYTLMASAEGFKPRSLPLRVKKKRSVRVPVELKTRFGTLSMKIADQDGQPLGGATWWIDEGDPQAVEGDTAQTRLDEGTYRVSATARGYRKATSEVQVVAGDTVVALLTLSPVRVKVRQEYIDIAGKVHFDTGRATIKAESFDLLDEVAETLVDHPELLQVRIEGHTDSRGSNSANKDLSDRRAASVRDYLVERGVEPSRLDSIGYGESRPIDPGENPEAWTMNRRVEFFITERAEQPE
jgi:outer membrane protein OmpA-like peptidoglycan-associated protein